MRCGLVERLRRAMISRVHDLAHSTELEIDNFTVDYTLENNGTVDELKAKIDTVLEEIG
jgi:hypothetical protein